MKPINKDKIKTRLCKHYLAGFCKLGEKCNFAHGIKFLRKPICIRTKKSSSIKEDRPNDSDVEEYEFV